MNTSEGNALSRGGHGFSVSLLLGAVVLASSMGWWLHAWCAPVVYLSPEPREVVVVPEPVLGGWVVDVEPGGVR